MASELTITAQLMVRNGNLVENIQPGSIIIDQASQVKAAGVQIIGTAAEAIALNDVTAAGWAFCRNLGTTSGQYIDIGTGTGTNFSALQRLYPGNGTTALNGEYSLFPMHPTNAPTARASTSQTASINLEYEIFSR